MTLCGFTTGWSGKSLPLPPTSSSSPCKKHTPGTASYPPRRPLLAGAGAPRAYHPGKASCKISAARANIQRFCAFHQLILQQLQCVGMLCGQQVQGVKLPIPVSSPKTFSCSKHYLLGFKHSTPGTFRVKFKRLIWNIFFQNSI